MKKRWIAIGIWSIGAILIGTGQLNGCLGLNEDRGMISYAAGQSQASKTIQNKIEKAIKRRGLLRRRKTLKKEVASLKVKNDVVSYIQSLIRNWLIFLQKVEQNETNLKKTKKEIRILKRKKAAGISSSHMIPCSNA